VIFSRVRRLILACSAAALAAGTAVITPATSTAQPSCPDVEIVFARGTSEPAGIGRVGQALADALAPQLGGRTLGTYGVNYPAGYDFLTTADGATDATNHITTMASQCPATRIVLGGYSQGAAVVDMLAGVPPLGNRIGEIGSAPPLPASAAGNVAAVAVFGNPATKFGNPLSGAGSFAGRAVDFCSDGDPICSDGRNPFAHTRYESSPFISQAAGFVAARV
jgi:cutinase